MTHLRVLPSWGTVSRSSALLLGASIAGAALAVGTVHTITLCAVTASLALAAALAWGRADTLNMRPAATVLLFTGVALTGYTGLQCVPLPLTLMRLIAPHNAEVWSRTLEALHQPGPSWAPLSLDPPATRVEMLKGVAYLLAFVTSLRLVRRRGGVSFLSGVLVVTGVALSLAAILHPAFGAHKLYGFIQPTSQIVERHLAPFINPNNLAAYLNIAFCIAFATVLSPDPRFPRSIAASVALMMAATQVWVASRGGVAAMALGAIAVVLLARVPTGERVGRPIRQSLALLAALATGGALVGFSALDNPSELLSTDAKFKVEVFHDAGRMLLAYPVFGVGRGAFESTFPEFRRSVWITTFSHPENVVLQWTIEWGLPVSIAAFVAIAYALRPGTALARSTTAIGPWAAILAVVVQNMVDLGTEIPGLMLAIVVCAAIVTGGSAGRRASWRVEAWGHAPSIVAASAVGTALVAIVLAYVGIDHELDAEQGTMFASAKEGATSAEEMRLLARAAMLRHPAEPYFPFVAGWRALREHDDDPMPWLEATLSRATVYPLAHQTLAELLARRSPAQARLEYRITMEQSPDLTFVVVPEAAKLVGGYDDAMELVPDTRNSTKLELLATSVAARLPSTRVRLDEQQAANNAKAAEPAARAALDAVTDAEGGPETPWCEGTRHARCATDAISLARHAEALDTRSCEPHALRARAEIAAGDPAAGVAALAAATDGVNDRVPCLERLAAIATSTHDDVHWRIAVERVASAGCSSDAECAANLSWAADQEEAHGKVGEALALNKQAYARTPSDDTLLERVARLAATAGLHTEAAEAYERLARKQPSEPRWKRAADTQRGAL